jgi:hypothetical protein
MDDLAKIGRINQPSGPELVPEGIDGGAEVGIGQHLLQNLDFRRAAGGPQLLVQGRQRQLPALGQIEIGCVIGGQAMLPGKYQDTCKRMIGRTDIHLDGQAPAPLDYRFKFGLPDAALARRAGRCPPRAARQGAQRRLPQPSDRADRPRALPSSANTQARATEQSGTNAISGDAPYGSGRAGFHPCTEDRACASRGVPVHPGKNASLRLGAGVSAVLTRT